MPSPEFLQKVLKRIQLDPGKRGLATYPVNPFEQSAPDFFPAVYSLAQAVDANRNIGIVTGFFIPTGEPPAGETDGPLGSFFLGDVLAQLGGHVFLYSDPHTIPALQSVESTAVVPERLRIETLGQTANDMPASVHAIDYWIALERVGPCHTFSSILPGDQEKFAVYHTPESVDRCYSMRGRDITELTRPAHWLFEYALGKKPTLGIGDGGNEIGMGKIPWDVIEQNIPGGGKVACRIATDNLIVAGVSNWGGYALAAGVAEHFGRARDVASRHFVSSRELDRLQTMVQQGPLVDGVRGTQTATVDGLDWEEYIAPLIHIREEMQQI